MQVAASRTVSTAIQTDLRAIFASLELSRSTWLITSLSPGAGEKMSKHSIRAGDVAGLLARLAQLKEKARGQAASTTWLSIPSLIQLAWLWLRHQTTSALSIWFQERVQSNGGKMRKTTIVALARKLLVALWKYSTSGVVIEGAVMRAI